VRPRASRLPGLKGSEGISGALNFSSKASKWLDDERLVAQGAQTNWKNQTKLRHNWSRGRCAVNEIEVAENAAVPPILVQMRDSVVYMADNAEGLRAWSAKGKGRMFARLPLSKIGRHTSPPTSMALDTQSDTSTEQNLVLGFDDGSFSLYSLDTAKERFSLRFRHEPSSNGVISAVSISGPLVATMTATQLLSLYRFDDAVHGVVGNEKLRPARLLHSLRSHTLWPPLSMSLRTSAANITISIAYALPTYLSGWTVGIQEVRITNEGKLLSSQLASAIEQNFAPLAFATPPMMSHLHPPLVGSLATSTTRELRQIHSKPTSLSYTHPYLLVSHPDNTLTLYLVTSTADKLTISAGTRLWGHTSSVSGAHVGRRGKAVSVSRRGDDLRVWELEGGFSSSSAKKRLAAGNLSVQIRPQPAQSAPAPPDDAGLWNQAIAARHPGAFAIDEPGELTLTRGWIDFDDENVVVLKESQGRQALVVYDFT
jgi:hypothetical protein